MHDLDCPWTDSGSVETEILKAVCQLYDRQPIFSERSGPFDHPIGAFRAFDGENSSPFDDNCLTNLVWEKAPQHLGTQFYVLLFLRRQRPAGNETFRGLYLRQYLNAIDDGNPLSLEHPGESAQQIIITGFLKLKENLDGQIIRIGMLEGPPAIDSSGHDGLPDTVGPHEAQETAKLTELNP